MNIRICLVLCLLFLGSCQARRVYTSSVQRHPALVGPETVPETEDKGETVKVKQEQVTLTHGDHFMQFCVIIGSFINEQNALELHKILVEAGYTQACILQNQDGMFQVAAKCYETEETARTGLLAIRHSDLQYADAWLLITE